MIVAGYIHIEMLVHQVIDMRPLGRFCAAVALGYFIKSSYMSMLGKE